MGKRGRFTTENMSGANNPRYKDGRSQWPEFHAWRLLLKRCYNSADRGYKNYGGRGIGVCATWRVSFDMFLGDMGRRPSPHHSLDRKDNNGPYDLDNCRWATRQEQLRNKRTNVQIEFNGVTRIAVEWAELTGISAGAITHRLQRGWSVEKTLTTPTRRRKVR